MAIRIAAFGGTFRDARGQVGRAGAYYRFTAGAGDQLAVTNAIDFVDALGAMSNAAVFGGYGLAANVQAPNQYGTNDPFPNVEDKAVLTILAADNTLHRISVPAPKTAIFYPDLETVDVTSTDVAALQALLASDAQGGFPSSRAGSALLLIVAGARARRRFQRKTTIWTLDPSETEPEE